MTGTSVSRISAAVVAVSLAFGVTLVAAVAPASAAPRTTSGTVVVVDGGTLYGGSLNGGTLHGGTLH